METNIVAAFWVHPSGAVAIDSDEFNEDMMMRLLEL
jgi:hypothetical protein